MEDQPENKVQDCCLFCFRPIPQESVESISTPNGVFCNFGHQVKLAGYLYICELATKESQKYPKHEVDFGLANAYLIEMLAASKAKA
ncbi:MAG: hypothetical protein WDN47_05220 [Candidatus Doudnabacteria bacterium]